MPKMCKIIDLEQGSPEWLAFRKDKIGGSDAPIIMGESPWATPENLIKRKLGLIPDQFQSPAMKHGKDMEPIARAVLESILCEQLNPVVVQNIQYPWMIASLDGMSLFEDTVVEIKCLRESSPDFKDCMAGIVPKKYWIQCQHIMMCLGIEKMFFFTWHPEYNKLVEVEKDLLFCEQLLKKELAFLHSLENYAHSTKIMQTERWSSISDEIKEIDARLKAFEEKTKADQARLDLLKAEMITLAEGEDASGYGVSLKKVVVSGKIEYDKIPELKAIDLSQYRKPPTIYYKVRVEKDGDRENAI